MGFGLLSKHVVAVVKSGDQKLHSHQPTMLQIPVS